jgi:hypothetical protein
MTQSSIQLSTKEQQLWMKNKIESEKIANYNHIEPNSDGTYSIPFCVDKLTFSIYTNSEFIITDEYLNTLNRKFKSGERIMCLEKRIYTESAYKDYLDIISAKTENAIGVITEIYKENKENKNIYYINVNPIKYAKDELERLINDDDNYLYVYPVLLTLEEEIIDIPKFLYKLIPKDLN